MPQRRTWTLGKLRVLLFAGAVAAGSGTSAWALILSVRVSPVLSISDETGGFALPFSNFVKGTRSSTQTVTYRIQANNMAPGALSAAITARLDSPFETAQLSGRMTSYTNLGASDFAGLQEVQPGSVLIGTTPAPLAAKISGMGPGDVCMHGNVTIEWQAELTEDTPAGSWTHLLEVTVIG